MKNLFLIALVFLCVSCASSNKNEYQFDVPIEEMTAAILKFRETDNEILFIFLISREGRVVRSELVEKKTRKLDNQDVNRIKFHLQRHMRYPARGEGEPEYIHAFHAVKHTQSAKLQGR